MTLYPTTEITVVNSHSALFTTVSKWNQARCPSTDEWIFNTFSEISGFPSHSPGSKLTDEGKQKEELSVSG